MAAVIELTSSTTRLPENTKWRGAKLVPTSIILCIAIALWHQSPPDGLNNNAWHLFIIFASTIVAIILKPMPMGSLAIIGICACTLTKTLTISQTLSSFSSKTVWLIVSAFLLARGFIKTGLGNRIAYHFVYFLGKRTIGLGYGLVVTETLLAPFIPSNTARGAGIIFPIVTSLSQQFNSTPSQGTEKKIGAYLIMITFHANIVTSAMFLTAMAANPLIAAFAEKNGVIIDWIVWAKTALVPGLLSLGLLPLLLYYIYPPEIKKTPEARSFARSKLQALGSMKQDEYIMSATFLLLLYLWVMGDKIGVDATTAAFLGLGILLFTGVLDWEDITSEKNAWSTFVWLTTLLMMTNFLAQFGLMSWFSHKVGNSISHFSWPTALTLLVAIYFYSHYCFASLTAHATSMFSVFAIVAISTGAPNYLAVLLLAFASNLCAAVTHYGTGTAPVYFSTYYVKISDWWRLGAIISLANMLIWGGIGSLWWKVLGFW